ncbi:MAG: response regulator [Oscillospiraceae bacterium]|nr:response regulator [Oscillospiraceae bacterium]
MYWYALVGVLATAVLIIQNYDILFQRGNNKNFPGISIYRKLLYGIMTYFVTDVLWGVLDSLELYSLLFLDTVIYYVAMAVGVLLWTQYVVTYLREENVFSRFLSLAGRFFFAAVVLTTVLNFFVPVLFWFDEDGVYHASMARHIQLLFQIVLLLLTSVYTLRALPKAEGAARNRYRTIFLFGLVVAVLLLIQIPYPFLPLYTIGYMLGSCLLHTFVVSNEMDELMQRQSELAIAANKAKTSFLSNMSHEIRTPINSILGMNEMILRESDDQNVLTYAENIRTAGNTLLGLVNDTLDFSKIEAGKMEIVPVDYNISSVINDLVNMVQTRADEKGLALVLHFNPDIPRMLHGDEIRIKQIATNLLTNAVKYTEAGTVTFSMDYARIPDDDGHITLTVSVRDTGIGIRQEDMEKLFSEFDRLEVKRNRSIEGTGLGMAISKKLLAMMDSHLEVESVYGEGSVFSFSLKQEVVEWERLGDYEESFRASVPNRRKQRAKFIAPDATILAVDDNPMNLMVLAGLLKRTRIHIDMVESGDECLQRTTEKKYDMILLDHMMPEKDGIETLHEMKAQKDNPNADTTVICLTANAISGAREQYIKAGFDDYLTKPIDSAKLEEMIMLYLPKEKIRHPDEEPAVEARAAEETAAPADAELPEPLRGLEQIDCALGLQNSGSMAAYLSLLKVFYQSMDRKAEEIESYYAAENWKDYTIQVHALKSSARIIGAAALGEKAQLLENAGKSGDAAYIRANHPEFMADYLSFKAPLAAAFAEETPGGEQPEADAERMERLYADLRTAAEEMDIEALENLFAGMRDYRVPASESARWSQLTDAASRYDYDAITELLE